MVSPAAAVAAAYFASDSIFLFCKEEWFRLQTAAMPELQRFLISGGQFGNHCMDLPENVLQSAMILDFRLRLENHYKVFLGISPNAAVILDFRGSIWESLQGNPQEWPHGCSDS